VAPDGSLRVAVDGPVATLTIDRPERRNAVDLASWRALPGVAARVADDPGVRVVVVRGAGRQAFSAGADLDDVAALVGRPDEGEAFLATVDAAVRAVAELPVPTIAMIHGPCIGGGWELAAACDLRFGADDARIAVPPARIGLVYSLAATERLLRLVGPSTTKRLLFAAEPVDAARARELGLLDEVHPPDVLEEASYAFARTVASRSSATVRAAKRVVRALQAGEEDPSDVRRAIRAAFAGDDFAEGVRAARQKRPPRFG
jgi:enoyl-CoA hydratase/carnithine racemase